MFRGLGVGGAAALLGSGPTVAAAEARPSTPPALWARPSRAGAAPVLGLHLTFGSDPAREMVVSWQTMESVSRPRVFLGTPEGGMGEEIDADTRTYTDGVSNRVVQVHTARLGDLLPDTQYIYGALHDGANPELGAFRTAPSGRASFTFTSFGDQAAPGVSTAGTPSSKWVNDALGTAFSSDLVAGVERISPLFHLVNGDLCYANLSSDRLRVWESWFANTSRSSRFRPWMPAAGNHENEKLNGPIGYSAYQTYFPVPSHGGDTELDGLWYAFTVGSVRVISLNNDDVCYQDGGDNYVHAYSGGAQKRWLEAELATSRANRDIDWIVVCMHQVVISTADQFNGADRGIREEWVPLFDRYGVDLVVCGHEHHYERSHPIRGQQPTDTLTPIPVSTATDVVDTTQGTVHMVIGGGGTSVPSNGLLFDPPRCRVIVGVGQPDPVRHKRPPVYVIEDAPWSAVRDREHPYGFAAFTVDPGRHRGDETTLKVTYYNVVGPGGALAPFDTFTLRRPRSDR
jgi:hypothetical protein